jgi:hypothetical protein
MGLFDELKKGMICVFIRSLTALLLLAIVSIASGCRASQGAAPPEIDVARAMSTIGTLSGAPYTGRCSGTLEGTTTDEYVSRAFAEIGLTPGGDNGTYYQTFSGRRGYPASPYILEVLDGAKVIKAFQYGTDFKLHANNEHTGDISAPCVLIDNADSFGKNAGGAIAVVPLQLMQAVKVDNLWSALTSGGYGGLIVSVEAPSVVRRGHGQTLADAQPGTEEMPRALVTTEATDELLTYSSQGYKVHLQTAFRGADYTARNVVGYIPAASPTEECLIVSAHMDHLSPDPDGVFYPGALDNASGTAAVIEIARALTQYRVKPSVNLVFIAFAAEEMSMQGSEYYASAPLFPLRTTQVLNMDMVGAAKDIPLTVMTLGGRPEGSLLYDKLRQAATNIGRGIEEMSGAPADHSSFQNSVDAVTLIDYDTEHANTPADDMHTVGEQNLRADIQIMLSVIQQLAYKDQG